VPAVLLGVSLTACGERSRALDIPEDFGARDAGLWVTVDTTLDCFHGPCRVYGSWPICLSARLAHPNQPTCMLDVHIDDVSFAAIPSCEVGLPPCWRHATATELLDCPHLCDVRDGSLYTGGIVVTLGSDDDLIWSTSGILIEGSCEVADDPSVPRSDDRACGGG